MTTVQPSNLVWVRKWLQLGAFLSECFIALNSLRCIAPTRSIATNIHVADELNVFKQRGQDFGDSYSLRAPSVYGERTATSCSPLHFSTPDDPAPLNLRTF